VSATVINSFSTSFRLHVVGDTQRIGMIDDLGFDWCARAAQVPQLNCQQLQLKTNDTTWPFHSRNGVKFFLFDKTLKSTQKLEESSDCANSFSTFFSTYLSTAPLDRSLGRGMAKEITVKILKMDLFTKRNKDIEKIHWFSFPIDLLDHPDFFEVNGDELMAFVWFICVAAKLKTDQVRMNVSHTAHKLRIKEATIYSMIEKLKGKQIDVVIPGMATDGGHTAATPRPLHNITEQDITKQNNIHVISDFDSLVNFWNEQKWSLPKVKSLTPSRKDKLRARLKEATIRDWMTAIERMHSSEFLLGQAKNSTWKADFDWLITNDTNRIKIIEGKYDTVNSKVIGEQRSTNQEDEVKKAFAEAGLG
jgi:hypothetical protein